MQNPQARVVVYPRGSLSSLYGLYFNVLIAQTLDELEEYVVILGYISLDSFWNQYREI